MASNIGNIKKLQTAINMKSEFKILYQTTQFFARDEQRPIVKYILRKSVLIPDTGRYEAEEIFSTYSQLHIVLYLRDLWYVINGEEVPTDNEKWEKVKLENRIDYKDVVS